MSGKEGGKEGNKKLISFYPYISGFDNRSLWKAEENVLLYLVLFCCYCTNNIVSAALILS